MNIFTCVIRMEEEVRICYEKLSASAAFPELKTLFTMNLQEAVCHFNPLLAKRDLFAELMEESHAYQLVIEREEEGIRYYEELAA